MSTVDPDFFRPDYAAFKIDPYAPLKRTAEFLRAQQFKERLSRFIVQPNGCWEWQGALDEKGYGRIGFKGRTARVHRVAFEYAGGALIDGLVLDHLCCNRRCMNPAHLEQVTSRENLERGRKVHSVRTHCKRGHLRTLENRKKVGKSFACRECHREDKRRYYAERKQA